MPTVVIEFGNCYCKVGIAGEILPRLFLKSEYDVTATNIPLQEKQKLQSYLNDVFVHKLRIKPKEYGLLIVDNLNSSFTFRSSVVEICLADLQVSKIVNVREK